MNKDHRNNLTKSIKIFMAFMAIAIIASSILIYQIIIGSFRTNSSISIFNFSQKTIPLYGTIEVNINVTAVIDNPFDPGEVNVSVVFTTPSSQIIEGSAFYYQEYDRSLIGNQEILTPIGAAFWKVRFTPIEVGEYFFYAKFKKEAHTETTESFMFEVASSSNRGFVRVSSLDRRFFRFDDGSSSFLLVTMFAGRGQREHSIMMSGSLP